MIVEKRDLVFCHTAAIYTFCTFINFVVYMYIYYINTQFPLIHSGILLANSMRVFVFVFVFVRSTTQHFYYMYVVYEFVVYVCMHTICCCCLLGCCYIFFLFFVKQNTCAVRNVGNINCSLRTAELK